MTIRNLLTATIAIVAFCSSVLQAQNVPTGFVVEPLATGFQQPNDFVLLPDGRFLIAERDGAVKLVLPGAVTGTLIGTIPNVRIDHPVRGVLSFEVQGSYAYVWATRTTSAFQVLSRFTLIGNLNDPTSTNLTLDPTSEVKLLETVSDNIFLHNGGCARFGPDGMLYLSTGDDGDCTQSADYTSHAGALLRLDVSGVPSNGTQPTMASLVPADNPFAADADVKKRLILAKGLRNPFSMCVDPVLGDMFIGDVGASFADEISRYERNSGQAPMARSFGWPWLQGNLPSFVCGSLTTDPGGHTAPIDERIWGVEGNAIMCAGVIRNLGGAYDFGPGYEFDVFHTDFYNGNMQRLEYDEVSGSWARTSTVPGQPDPNYWGTGFAGAHRFRLGHDGASYFLQRSADGQSGTLKRIRGSGQVAHLSFVSGSTQTCASGQTFGQPVRVQVTDNFGNPVVGAAVEFESPDGSASFSAVNVTDANGETEVTVTSTGIGQGPVQVAVKLLGATPIAADLFGRKLAIRHTQGSIDDQLDVDFFNRSFDAAPQSPILFALTWDTQPIYPTFLGDLHIDLVTLGNTVIIEDGGGTWGNANHGSTPPFATPNWQSTYTAPTGFLSGITVRFQLLVWDNSISVSQLGALSTHLGTTNPIRFTYP